jgi:PST family polysaccharide transporter
MDQGTKRFAKHLFHLTLLKGFSRLLPLITVPLLIRTIGLEQLGVIKWIEAMADYFLVFIGYGFRYTATQQVASHHQDKPIIGQIVGAVYSLKLVAIALCALVSWLLILYVPQLQEIKAYWWTYYLVIVISMLYPCFVLQGLDQMHWLTGINLVSKISFVVAIAWYVHKPADTLLYHQLLAASYLLRLIIAWIVIYYKLHISIRLPGWNKILFQIKAGFYLFLGQLATSFYIQLPAITLGFWEGTVSVATYVVGSKIVYMLISMIEPFTQALYPVAYQKWKIGVQTGLHFVQQITLTGLFILGSIGLAYGHWAHEIIKLLAGQAIPESVQVLRLYITLPCIHLVTNRYIFAIESSQ